MKNALKYAFVALLAFGMGAPIIGFAASFGTQNFFYAPGNVITALPGFTTSWASGSGSGNVSTSTGETVSRIAYWTTTNSTPAKLGSSNNFVISNNLVGIGTTTPFFALTVASSSGPQIAITDTTAGDNAWTLRSISNSLYIATSTANATSTTAAVAIDPNGNVTFANNISIGSAGCTLVCFQASSTINNGNGGWTAFMVAQPLPNGITIPYTTGNVGIASSTPQQTLEVGGNIDMSGELMLNDQELVFASTTAPSIYFAGLNAGAGIIANAVTNASYPNTTAIGSGALQNATTSSTGQNTAVGYQAMQGSGLNTSFNNDTAVGFQALKNITTAAVSTAVGVVAGSSVTIGGGQALFGEAAGTALTSGANNTYVGWTAGQHNTTGVGNVAVGATTDGSAGSTATHSYNTVLGYQSASTITTGGNNVYIGVSTASTTATGSGNITIGNDLSGPQATANGSNMLDIGNLIFGNGLTSQASSSPAGTFSIASSTNSFTAGLSFGTTNGVCHVEKAAGSTTSYTYYYFTSAPAIITTNTPCTGSGTTTVIED